MTKRKKPQPQNIPAIQNAEVIPQDDKFENSFSEAIGIGGGVNPNFPFGDSIAGIPGSAQVENVGTIFRNLRWYLISNMRQVLSQAYVEIGLVQTICDVPVDDALRGGINIKSKQLEESQLEELISAIDRDGNLIEVGQAAKWNRLFGGAGILVLTDQDPEEPLDWDSLENEKVDFRAVDMWELFWDKQNTEDTDLSGNLEEFEFYNYYGEHVHKSRVLRIKGLTAPSFIRPRLRGWGFSVVEILVRSINQYLKGTDLAFEVLDEFKVDVYKIKNLVQSLMSPQGEAAIKKRIQIANWQKNYQNALTMDSEDDWDHKQLSFQGLGDAMMQIRMQVAADMRMPITKLFGISAAGFNSGEDDIEVYNAMVEAQVRNKIKQVIVKLVEIKCQCLFGFVPDDLSVEFEPLRIMSSEQEETVKTQQFSRLLQSLQSGAMSLKEFRAACNKAQLFDVTLDVEDANLEKAYEAAKKAEMGGGKEDGESGADSEKGSGNGDKPRKEKPDAPDKEKPKTATAEKPKKQLANDFDESKVKRDDDGKFSTKGGGSISLSKKQKEILGAIHKGEKPTGDLSYYGSRAKTYDKLEEIGLITRKEKGIGFILTDKGKEYINKSGKGSKGKEPPKPIKSGDKVDGREVRDEIPNQDSIDSSLNDYEILEGVHEISMSHFTYTPPYSKSEMERTKELAEQIKESKSINPLIVVEDAEGYYVLEGGHRFDALNMIGAKSFPALIVRDLESLNEEKQLANDFDESKIKRDDDGKFSTKGGGEAPTKKRRPGKLEVNDNWNVTGSFHARDGEKGEDGYSCEHCGKGIKRIVTMSSPDHDSVSVGADCAEALVEGTAKQKLDEFYDRQKKEAKKQKADRKAEIDSAVSAEMSKWDTTNKKDQADNFKFLSKAISEAAYHSETGTRLSPRIDPDSIDTKQKWKLLKEALKMQVTGERGSAFQFDGEIPEGAKLRGATTDWATYLVPLLDKMASKKQNTLFIMPRPYTPGQLAKRAILNSARFDRKSYEADGGDNWIEPKRKHFFDREKADDKGLWDRATQASRDSLGDVRWQFQVWYYKKHGGRFGSGEG